MAISGPRMWPDTGALPRQLQVVRATWEVGGPVGQKDGMTEPGIPACVARWVSVDARIRWPGRRAWLCRPPAVCAWAAMLASLGLSFLFREGWLLRTGA